MYVNFVVILLVDNFLVKCVQLLSHFSLILLMETVPDLKAWSVFNTPKISKAFLTRLIN